MKAKLFTLFLAVTLLATSFAMVSFAENKEVALVADINDWEPGPWLNKEDPENNFYSVAFKTSVDFTAFKFFFLGDPGAEGTYALYGFSGGKYSESPAASGAFTAEGDGYIEITFQQTIEKGEYKMVLKSTGNLDFCLAVSPNKAEGIDLATECQSASNSTPDNKYLLSFLIVIPEGSDSYFLPLESITDGGSKPDDTKPDDSKPDDNKPNETKPVPTGDTAASLAVLLIMTGFALIGIKRRSSL